MEYGPLNISEYDLWQASVRACDLTAEWSEIVCVCVCRRRVTTCLLAANAKLSPTFVFGLNLDRPVETSSPSGVDVLIGVWWQNEIYYLTGDIITKYWRVRPNDNNDGKLIPPSSSSSFSSAGAHLKWTRLMCCMYNIIIFANTVTSLI